jgi:hypothetical protein
MKNPGIDVKVWKQLREKWTELDANGHSLKVDFKLVTNESQKDRALAIDVVQSIDDAIIVETVQRQKGEAYAALGISELSVERLKDIYKEMMAQLHGQLGQADSDLVITMSPTSETSGEIRGYLQSHDEPVKQTVLIDYQHYYILNALREKMIEQIGENWKQVKAIYQHDAVEFCFEQ